ncbi:MAG: undecaprenyl/decaprenyl-phosphate alpha-N-acetylglucosaminyl 1-phosphate transferase [Planctomycetaceae bacterium]|nr:undecaprenyl/decaprenyl-phosphate alpha-N-acetylglucosaminyl 1-phosphate transferase [Planctomycetaceae bacterium]
MTRLMISWAPQLGLIDQPAARKSHTNPTPLGGGLGIVLGVVLTLGMAHGLVWAIGQNLLPASLLPADLNVHLDGVLYRAPQMWGLLTAGLILSIVGLVDDVRPVSWRFRLIIQFLVAMAVIAADIRATMFDIPPIISWTLTVFWLVLLINSLNFLDNMDGLTSGITLISSILFAIVMLTQTSEPRWLVAGMLLVIAGACSGFLVWNWSPARIFMGDAGSTFLGLMLGCLTILGTFYDVKSSADTHVMLAPLCVLAVPLYDFLSVMTIRIKRGLSPFHADKNHFSHRLVDLGLSRKNAVLTIYLCTITTGLAGLLLYRLPGWGSAWTVIVLVICVLLMISILETAGRRAARQREEAK